MSDDPDYVPFPPERIPEGGIVIEFPENNPRVAGQLATGLKSRIDDAISDEGASAKSTIEKVDKDAQDVGTIIAIVLGAKATIAIAASCIYPKKIWKEVTKISCTGLLLRRRRI